MELSYLDINTASIRKKINDAALASGRDPENITLMAAVKSAEVEEINYLHRELGINDVGENRVQQLLSRWDSLDREGLRVHFIGSLQTNKVKYIIDKVCMIHSLDSVRLAREIDRQARAHGLVMDVLVEINSGSEESKGGVEMSEVEGFCREIITLEGIKLCGFMTMAPRCEDPSEYIGYFTDTERLCREVWSGLGRTDPMVLSMGMSESYEQAVACGSTMVRVGRTFFLKAQT